MSTTTMPPSFVAPEHVTVEINGVERKFYAMSLSTFFELNVVAKPVITAIATLLDPPKQGLRERIKSGDNEKITYDAVQVEVVKLGAAAREKAIAELVDALLTPKNATLLRAVLVDSLRDDFPRGVKLTKEQEAEFARLDVPTALAFVKAFIAANTEALRPLMEGVTEQVREAVAAVTPTAT